MNTVNLDELVHQKPRDNYPYAASAQVFHTDQVFLYSEEVAPGEQSSAPHYHKKIDEVILVMEGELTAFEGDRSTKLKSGDTLLFKANSQELHYLKNESQTKARFLLFRASSNTSDVEY